MIAPTLEDVVTFIPEPKLEFRHLQPALDPRDGLALFGPYDADAPGHPRAVSYGLIGTDDGIRSFLDFSQKLIGPVTPVEPARRTRLWPAFPGFEAAFECRWPEKATRTFELDSGRVLESARHADPYKRAYQVVGEYLGGVASLKSSDYEMNLVVCVVPELVHRNCRPLSQVEDSVGTRISLEERRMRARKVQSLLDPDENLAPYQYSVDFRRQLKARAMEHRVPLQLIRDSTLRVNNQTPRFGERLLTPLSDRAWNLGSAMYYKGGGKPWRLMAARDGVCYVGIVFRHAPPMQKKGTACCAAQMFLDDGDGIVLRGDFGPWYSPDTKECHLDRAHARTLLARVLDTYHETFGKQLAEVFLHYRVSITPEEYAGFLDACPPGVKLVAVKIRDERGRKLYREGTMPVRRGTAWKLGDRSCYLWASGFKPRLGTYDGSETPVPLRIDLEHGTGDILRVATDILGLTKLNYNECRFGDSQPVTIGFSGAVGDILVSNPDIKDPDRHFRSYI